MRKWKGRLREEEAAFKNLYGINIRRLPRRALRLLCYSILTWEEAVYVAREVAKLVKERRDEQRARR